MDTKAVVEILFFVLAFFSYWFLKKKGWLLVEKPKDLQGYFVLIAQYILNSLYLTSLYVPVYIASFYRKDFSIQQSWAIVIIGGITIQATYLLLERPKVNKIKKVLFVAIFTYPIFVSYWIFFFNSLWAGVIIVMAAAIVVPILSVFIGVIIYIVSLLIKQKEVYEALHGTLYLSNRYIDSKVILVRCNLPEGIEIRPSKVSGEEWVIYKPFKNPLLKLLFNHLELGKVIFSFENHDIVVQSKTWGKKVVLPTYEALKRANKDGNVSYQ